MENNPTITIRVSGNTGCPNCTGHLARISTRQRECENCGRLITTGETMPSCHDKLTTACYSACYKILQSVKTLQDTLAERADPPAIIYQWPETTWSRTNTTEAQLFHVLSEVDEITELGPTCGPHLHMEMADLHHSLETYWRILARKHGPEYVAAVFESAENKNRQRGYYTEAP